MAQGITYSKEVVAKILEDYKQTKSIYQAAKINKVHYLTAQKYIKQSGIDGRSLLPQLRTQSPIYIYKDIYKEKDIKIREDNIYKKDTDKILSPNNKITDKTQQYISKLSPILLKMIKRYKDEADTIPIEKLYLSFGTLFDKYDRLTGRDKAGPDSQVIMNFYGDTSKVNKLLDKIKQSKGSL